MSKRQARNGRRSITKGLIASLAVAASLVLPSTAGADLLESFTAEVRDQAGDPFTQAGGHPFEAFTDIDFHTHDVNGQEIPDESVRTIQVDLPAGLVGNPQNIPTCTREELMAGFGGGCPANSQVGVTVLETDIGTNVTGGVFNMQAPEGQPAQFAFIALIPPVFINASVRPDGGLTVEIPNNSQALPLIGTQLTFWGVPGDPAHDAQRGPCLNSFDPDPANPDLCPFQGTVLPFLSNPTSCTGPVTTVLRANSWQRGGFESLSSTTPVGADGCDVVPFNPSIDVQATSSSADSPTGLSVDVNVPQNQNPTGITVANLRSAEVTLPAGTTVNPAAADGLAGCTEAEVGLGNTNDPACPDASKIGSVEIDSPLQADPLRGAIYQATPDANPFGSLLAIYIVAQGNGVTVKLPGEITADPATGQLTTTINDAPQVPFSRFGLSFFGGSRGALATPTTCGTKTASAELGPWSGTPPVTAQSSYQITSGANGGACAATDAARPFAPTLVAGLTNPVGGASSPFNLAVNRADGEQELTAIDATLPAGVSAVIKGVPQCAEADAAAGTCGPASLVGSATTTVGAGSNPYQVSGGEVFLAGPYNGAPLSLVISVPAQAGIFDLGTVLVRAAVFVDPVDAHLRVVSDPIPTILEGIPLRIRQIALAIDREGFMTSPTSCLPQQVGAQLAGANGASAAATQPFQVAGCSALPFAPQMTTKITGGKQATKRSQHPGLEVTLSPREGDANVKRVQLLLAKQIFLDQANLRGICTREQYAANQCPADSIYGTAEATTPLLDSPVAGNVYLRASNNPLPDLVADLNGQVDIDLVGRVDGPKGGGIRTTFETVPDVPVSNFKLTLNGGNGGLLVNSKPLCKQSKLKSKVQIDGQNGKGVALRPKLKAPCGKKK